MLSLRLLRARAPARGIARLATAAAHPTVTRTSSPSSVEAAIPLSNVESQWERLTPDEQLVIHRQLEELQKKDWKALSLDEKRAGELHTSAFARQHKHFTHPSQRITLPLDPTDPAHPLHPQVQM
jgi:hypothetical protein